nr:MAG TPA: hypothetical protein [Caudoviricetes sp.]
MPIKSSMIFMSNLTNINFISLRASHHINISSHNRLYFKKS